MATFVFAPKYGTITSNGNVTWFTLYSLPFTSILDNSAVTVAYSIHGAELDSTGVVLFGDVHEDGKVLAKKVAGTTSVIGKSGGFNAYGDLVTAGYNYEWTDDGSNVIFRVRGAATEGGLGPAADIRWVGFFEAFIDK